MKNIFERAGWFSALTVLVAVFGFPGICLGNTPPTVSITAPGKTITSNRIKAIVGESVCFQAMASDPDNDPLKYSWDFGDGSAANANPAACHTYAKSGFFSIKLTVDDGYVPPQQLSLLTGKTPATLGTPPVGWTVVTTQDFEGGSAPSNQSFGHPATANNPHSGAKSMEGAYSGDGGDVRWKLNEGNTGTFSEVYVSFYDFMETQGRFNDELFFFHFQSSFANYHFQELTFDIFGGGNSASNSGFNSPSAGSVLVSGSDLPEGICQALYGADISGVWGVWTQWEMELKPNTPGQSDGVARVYKNGALFYERINANLNAGVSMNNMSVETGGTYTKLTWVKSDGSCGDYIGDGNDNGPRVSNFNSCSCPNQCPPSGIVPTYKRYMDDIIVMKK
jgi:PKD repeat protein